jgi:radical SAM protein with 4Fe4S-binding SPASM domain
VLGAHNRDALPDAYDWVSEFAEGWRILPAFAGGPEENIARLQLPEEDVVRTFLAVFERRANAKKHIPIAPIDDYIRAAALKIGGQTAHGDVDRDVLDNIFVINVNGDVFTRPFAYDAQFRLGNINCDSMAEIVERETYRSCQAAIRRRKIRNCASCDYRGICNSSPMHEHGSVTRDGICVVPRRSIAEIGQVLSAAGVDRAVIADWARETWAAV